MPLYLDIHNGVEGMTPEGIEEAHRKDLEVQDRFDVRYLKYWYDNDARRVFCLVEAPDADAAKAVHRESHGVLADEIIEVTEGS